MRKIVYKSCVSAMAIGLASLSGNAFAQDAESEETSALDEIVVTASSGNRTQLNSAVAVTSIDADLVENFKPNSEAEVFRLIPGIQASGTSGPGGNANIAVRGLPVATGGSPFVQLQEDGLPTVLFGDIQFGNNDYWTRFDASVERLQSVRGGGATTFTSQAPGAVINYISNTGKEQGGYIQLSKGIDFNDTKLDFRYGAPITEDIRFHVGGMYRNSNGPLNNFKVSDSIQIKANVTGEFAEGKGYVRALFKFADTQDPNYTGAPALATKNGNKIGDFKPFPGFDGRKDSNYSNLNRTGLFLNRAGALEREKINGITTKQLSAGMQFHYELSDNFTIDNNFRGSKISGGFASPFLNVTRTSGIIGSVVNGQTVAAIRYASGPNAGQLYTATYLDNNVNVRTKIRDLGSLTNNLTLSGEFGNDGLKITPRAGFFYMRQDIALDWHVNRSTRALDGNNPAQLDLFNAAGNKLTVEGISGYNNNWGDCCARDYDLQYTNTAPYVALELDSDMFGLDASVRFERIKAEGGGRAGGAPSSVVSSGVTIPILFANGPAEKLDYTRSYRSWTIGGLFKPTEQLSIFARASEGGRFNSDRQTFGGKFSATGGLCTSAQAQAGTGGCRADGVTPSVDFVKQYEVGLKNAGSLGGGRYSLELSLLKANFKQSTFELSATRCPGGAGGCVIDAKYKSSGAEFYGTYRSGGLNLIANATYTKAKQLNSGATSYRRASFLPDLTYTVSANYDIADLATLGVAATGQSSIRDDGGNVYEGGAIFNGNIAFRPIKNVEIGLQAYNIFNSLDFRGNGNTVVESTGTTALVSGTPVIGRTFSASARFSF
jgi:outer membrane receptor protein involved in Fe transport